MWTNEVAKIIDFGILLIEPTHSRVFMKGSAPSKEARRKEKSDHETRIQSRRARHPVDDHHGNPGGVHHPRVTGLPKSLAAGPGQGETRPRFSGARPPHHFLLSKPPSWWHCFLYVT